MSRSAIIGLLTMLFIVATSYVTMAGHRGCQHCRRSCPCQVVCVLKCEIKEVELTCWSCKCEDFCIPGPSRIKCRHRENVCAEGCCSNDRCNCDQPKVVPKKFVWFDWCVGRAEVAQRKRLMKKTVTKKVPSYHWEVQELCRRCEPRCGAAVILPGTEELIPAPPIPTAKLKYGGDPIALVAWLRQPSQQNSPSSDKLPDHQTELKEPAARRNK